MNFENEPRYMNDEVEINNVVAALIKARWIILSSTTIVTLIAIIYAISIPDIYKSEVTLAPVNEGNGMNIQGQLGGLAALAGVNIGGKGVDKTALALETLKSRDFLGQFIEQNDLYVAIFAAKGWDRTNNTLIIDREIYDESTKQWVREVKAPYKPKPSVLEAIESFNSLYAVSQDKTTGIVKISIQSYSPYLSKAWVDDLVKRINEKMRNLDLVDADKRLNYLNRQLKETNVSEIRSLLFSLIEEQTKTKMLANARDEYILKTVDSAVVPEVKSGPKRHLIVVAALIISFVLSFLYIIIVNLARRTERIS